WIFFSQSRTWVWESKLIGSPGGLVQAHEWSIGIGQSLLAVSHVHFGVASGTPGRIRKDYGPNWCKFKSEKITLSAAAVQYYTFVIHLLLLAAVFTCGAMFMFVKIRRSRTDPSLQCPHCGYSLTGNTSGVCPECGTEARRDQSSSSATLDRKEHA